MSLAGLALVGWLHAATSTSTWSVGGYGEAYFQWNAARPKGGVTAYRGFDGRAESLTLSNAALEVRFDNGEVLGRVALQVGATPSSYYAAEPTLPAGPGVPASDPGLWKYLQEVRVGWRLPWGPGLVWEAGLFLSPIGPESIAVKDHWNWSRSNLFFGLPFYHSGARLTSLVAPGWTVVLGVFNGWNNVLDNNVDKSVQVQLQRSFGDGTALSVLYFGGNERPTDAAEGSPWRHTFDSHLTVPLTPEVSLLAHLDLGVEPNRYGTSAWAAGALYARWAPHPLLALSVRGDVFYERVGANDQGRATPIFWPVEWVASGTATWELRPVSQGSLRLEYRHDHGAAPLFLDHQGAASRRAQDTFTVGLTAWL